MRFLKSNSDKVSIPLSIKACRENFLWSSAHLFNAIAIHNIIHRNVSVVVFGDFLAEIGILFQIGVAEVIFKLLTKQLLAWVIDTPVSVFLDF